MLLNCAKYWNHDFCNAPEKLVLRLHHKYQNASLSFATLKDKDRMILKLLESLVNSNLIAIFQIMIACVKHVRPFNDPITEEETKEMYEPINTKITEWITSSDNDYNNKLKIDYS